VNGSNNGRKRLWYLLLLAPFIGLLFPGWYSTNDPELFGFPFFYWYQFAWVILAALITLLVYVLTRSERE
jgi:hypothetical protein